MAVLPPQNPNAVNERTNTNPNSWKNNTNPMLFLLPDELRPNTQKENNQGFKVGIITPGIDPNSHIQSFNRDE